MVHIKNFYDKPFKANALICFKQVVFNSDIRNNKRFVYIIISTIIFRDITFFIFSRLLCEL